MKRITFILGRQKAGKTYFTKQTKNHSSVSVINTGELVKKLSNNDSSSFNNLFAPSAYDNEVIDYVRKGIEEFVLDEGKEMLFVDSFPRNEKQILWLWDNDIILPSYNFLYFTASPTIRFYRSIISGRSHAYFEKREIEERESIDYIYNRFIKKSGGWEKIDTSVFGIGVGSTTEILIQIVDERSGSRFKQHISGDVGFDIECWNKYGDGFTIEPNSFMDITAGLKIKVGDNCWGCIRPRSGAHFKLRLQVMEGTIDSGYTGDLFVCVYNPNSEPVFIKNGNSLAQIIPVPKFSNVVIKTVNEFPITERGERGFGSTNAL